MIAYFDTSAMVPLVVAEVGSPRALALWEGADRVASVRLVYPETRAALAQARRLGRLTGRQLRQAVAGFETLYDELDVVEFDGALARTAGDIAESHGLRGYDAVHLAAADRLRDSELVFVAGDAALLAASASKGIAAVDIMA